MGPQGEDRPEGYELLTLVAHLKEREITARKSDFC
jgi:hypothetical protein